MAASPACEPLNQPPVLAPLLARCARASEQVQSNWARSHKLGVSLTPTAYALRSHSHMEGLLPHLLRARRHVRYLYARPLALIGP
eukprot:5873193-Prymnesium_polylepis.1